MRSMRCNAKIRLTAVFILFFISSCTDNRQESPYEDILTREPFSLLTDSIKNKPKDDGLYFRRAVLLNSNNLPEPALVDFQKAWSLNKDERYALAIGNLLLEKKPDSAILFLNNAIKELSHSFLLDLTLARAYAAQNQIAEALTICNIILQKNPQQVDVLKLKADLLDKKGNSAEATVLLENAYHITPFDVELNYVLALRYAEAKDPRVLSICDSLIKADTEGKHAEPYYYKGIYYSNTGDSTKALNFFSDAIRHDYNFLDAYIEMGGQLYEMKKYADALATFNLALTISPQFADAYYWIAKSQEAMGQKPEAKANYQRAYSLDQTMIEAKQAADRIIN
ncbi:MAG TPA: tetratricopeptide repeat protein [Chitinophagaceae bacterium]|nr:tetratricopeptide repeat protein [Chitinophagaceae bacterium]